MQHRCVVLNKRIIISIFLFVVVVVVVVVIGDVVTDDDLSDSDGGEIGTLTVVWNKGDVDNARGISSSSSSSSGCCCCRRFNMLLLCCPSVQQHQDSTILHDSGLTQ